MIPVVQIIRVSSEEQAREGKTGLERQRYACEGAAETYKLAIVHRIELAGVSGDRVADTPEWNQAVAILASGAARGVVVDSTERLLRATEFDFRVFATLCKLGVVIWTPAGPRDPADPNDGLLLGILALLGGREKSDIVRRAHAGKEVKRRRGEWVQPLAMLPHGVTYDRSTKQWSYTSDVDEVVAAFRRVAAGETIRSVSASIGRRHQSVRVWLRNEIYAGWLVFDERRGGRKTAKADGRQADRPKVDRPAHEIIRIRVLDPPAVDRPTWEAVQAVLSGNIASYRQRRQDAIGPDPFTYRGLLFCAGCGARLDVRGSRSKGNRYHCANVVRKHGAGKQTECNAGAIRTVVVDDVVADAVTNRLANPAFLARTIEEYLLSLASSSTEDEIGKIQAKLASAQAKRSRLLDLYLSGGWSQGDLDAKRIPLDREIAMLEASLTKIETAAPQPSDVVDVARRLASAFVGFRRLDAESRREMLVVIHTRIYIWQEASRKKADRPVPVIDRVDWDLEAALRPSAQDGTEAMP